MFAAVVTVTIDPAQADAALSFLQEHIVPAVKASPGFISGVWLQPVDGRSASTVVFDTEANARSAVPQVGPAPAPGVVVVSVDFAEVAVTA